MLISSKHNDALEMCKLAEFMELLVFDLVTMLWIPWIMDKHQTFVSNLVRGLESQFNIFYAEYKA